MKRLKAFKHIFAKSVTSIDYYKELQNVDIRFSMKYYFVLALVLALTIATVDTIKSYQQVSDLFTNLSEGVLEVYPEELIIEVKDGNLSINLPEPLIIPVPITGADEKNGSSEDFYRRNIVVFDSQGTINDLEKYSTYILVNEKNILVDDGSEIQAHPISNLPNGTFQRSDLEQFVVGLDVLANFAPLFMFIVTFSALAFYYIVVRTIYLLPVAAILMGVGYLRNIKYKYSKFYQIGLHAMTIPLLIELALILGEVDVGIPLWFFVVNVVLGVVVVFSFSGKEKTQA